MADDSFNEFVLDQLSALPDVRAKAMFGAHGLYSGEHFFGILDEGRLFFKTDAQSQADYTGARHGAVHLRDRKGKVMTMSVSRSAAGCAGTTTGTSRVGAQSHRRRRRRQETRQKSETKYRCEIAQPVCESDPQPGDCSNNLRLDFFRVNAEVFDGLERRPRER